MLLFLAGTIFGVVSMVFLFRSGYCIPYLCSGGMKRWVAYSIIIWLICFEGYLL
jgi:hypothetical protein